MSAQPYGANQITPVKFARYRSADVRKERYKDPESGLIYLRARYYDPSTGQFLSVDPAFSVSGSRYGYVGGDPLNGTDPSGLLCVTLWDSNCESFAHQHAKGAQQVANFAGGVLNGITLGHGRGIIDNFGPTEGKVNYCSTEYGVGTAVGVGIDAAAAGGAWADNPVLDESGMVSYGKSEVPSWVFNEGYGAEPGETPLQAAARIMNEQYGEGNCEKGPGSEFNKIVKWVSRTGG